LRRTWPLLACFLLINPPTQGGEIIFPDGTPASVNGGLMIIRQGDQTIRSLGGGLFPRRVTVTQATPEGPAVARFTLPSTFYGWTPLPMTEWAPGIVHVAIPDSNGIVYIEGDLIRSEGTLRQFQSPPLPPGKAYPLHVRAAFKVGDNLLIEGQQVLLRAGQVTAVTFSGSRAISVPLPAADAELPPPRKLQER
jgi:uncharacterized protein (TIGR03000 family)